jgi:hypothetical protein
MRKLILEGIDRFFRAYVSTCVKVWLAFMVLDLMLAFVIPSGGGSIWYPLAGTTGGAVIALLVTAVLKAAFHRKVMRALDNQRGPCA